MMRRGKWVVCHLTDDTDNNEDTHAWDQVLICRNSRQLDVPKQLSRSHLNGPVAIWWICCAADVANRVARFESSLASAGSVVQDAARASQLGQQQTRPSLVDTRRLGRPRPLSGSVADW